MTKKERAAKPFLKTRSAAFTTLERVVKENSLINDLKYLINFNHTGTLEVYHSLYNKYCPKRLHFSYKGMMARSQLAVLDFNAGVGLKQAETKLGNLDLSSSFQKLPNYGLQKRLYQRKTKLILTI